MARSLECLRSIVDILPGSKLNKFKTAKKFPTIVDIERESRQSFPLSFSLVQDYISNRVALIGDSAHRIHPLAGQGVNIGWFDAQSLTNCLELACREGGDFGSQCYLKNYDSQTQKHNTPLILAIDLLNQLYSTDFKPFILARSFGLDFVEKSLPLKDLIVQRAS